MSYRNNPKYQVGMEAFGNIKNSFSAHTVLGFGAGMTVLGVLGALNEEGSDRGKYFVFGSEGTRKFATEQLGIPERNVLTPDDALDQDYLYVDGADQADPRSHLIKGGFKGTGDPGNEGCMRKEKDIAYAAKEFIVVIGGEKNVSHLGHGGYRLPVEYQPEREAAVRAFLEETLKTDDIVIREGPDGRVFVTENRGRIFDSSFDGRNFPELPSLEYRLEGNDGVIATGLFAARRPDTTLIVDGKKIHARHHIR